MKTILPVVALSLLVSPSAAAASQIYFGSSALGGGLFRMNLDGSARVEVKPANDFFYAGVAVDSIHGRVYWSITGGAGSPGGIFSSTLVGSDDVLIVPEVRSDYIAVDGAHNRLCWLDIADLRCADLDGGNVVTVVDTTDPMGVGAPTHMAFDLATGALYWTRINPDGGAAEVFIDASSTPTHSTACGATPLVAIDHLARKLYLDCGGAIQQSDLTGANVVAFPNLGIGDQRGLSLDPFGGKLYVDQGTGFLHRANLDTTGLEQIANVGANRGTALFLQELAPVSCTVTDDGTSATIRCPDGTSATISDGAAGADGANGTDGSSGVDGAPGANGADGTNGADGPAGTPGADGTDGTGCTVTQNDDGSATITCPDGTAATVASGGCASVAAVSPVGVLALLGLSRRRRLR